MATIRQLRKQRDLQGLTFGLMRVGEWVTRQPLRWRCVCTRCAVAQVFEHTTLLRYEHSLTGPLCQNSGCGKDALMEALAETPAKIRQRERQRQAEAQHQRELAEAERLEALKAENAKHQRALAELTKERIAKLKDDGLTIDPATPKRLTEAEAEAYNQQQIAAFRRARPDAYLSPANIEALGDFFDRNDVRIVSSETLAQAYERLNTYGFLEQAPKPKPQQQPKPKSAPATASVPAIAATPAPTSELNQGWDPATGLQRAYSSYEIDRMSADQFRRIFRIVKADLELPNVGPRG